MLRILVCTLAIGLCAPAAVHAQVARIVGVDGGCARPSIEAALRAPIPQPGARTILVEPGSYAESWGDYDGDAIVRPAEPGSDCDGAAAHARITLTTSSPRLVRLVSGGRLRLEHVDLVEPGQIQVQGAMLIAVDTLVDGGASTTASSGGLLAVTAGGTVRLRGGSLLRDGSASGDGGCAAVTGTGSSLLLDGAHAEDCSSGGDGGAIYVGSGGSLELRNGSSLVDNSAGCHGGAVHGQPGSSIRIANSAIIGNCADCHATVSSRGSTHIEASVLSDNLAQLDGGAVAVAGGVTTLVAVELLGNRARSGGGAAVFSGSLRIRESLVEANHATETGGGLAALGGELTVVDSIVRANEAATGGGVAMSDAGATLDGVTVESNRSRASGGTDGAGGGLALTSESVMCLRRGTALHDNEADGHGGAVLLRGGSELTLRDTSVAGNRSGGLAGGAQIVAGGPGPARLVSYATGWSGNSPAAVHFDGGPTYTAAPGGNFRCSTVGSACTPMLLPPPGCSP